MNKKEEFKSFVAAHPNLVNVVRSKDHTWQDLYEVYDLYGSDESLWDRYLNNTEVNSSSTASASSSQISSLGELTKLFKNVNIDNVQKYIDTAQKAIGVIQELTGSSSAASGITSGPSASRPINKIFED